MVTKAVGGSEREFPMLHLLSPTYILNEGSHLKIPSV